MPRRTSPLAALFQVFAPGQVRNLLPVLVIAASSGRFFLILAIGGILGLAYGALSWWRRRWSFRDGVLHLDEGIFVQNQRRIPVERIQHVEVERRLRHQLFELAAVRVETAGGSKAELRLDAITMAEATTLRSTVLSLLRTPSPPVVALDASVPEGPVDALPAPPPPPPPPPEVLVRLPASRLLLAGIVGPEVAAVFVALAFVIDTITDLGIEPDSIGEVNASRILLAVLIVLAVPAWFVVAGLVSLVRRWDFTASIAGDELRVTYGLLQKNEFVVKTERVRDVQIAERLVLRPFRRADLRVRTAASGNGDQSRVDIPMLSAEEIERILWRVLPAAVPLPPVSPAPAAARRRALIRSGVIGGVVALALGGVVGNGNPIVGLLVAAVLWTLALGWGELWYRGLGLARTRGAVHSRTGALSRRRAIVPERRIQSAAVRATFFQRRRRLGSVRLDLAGTSVGVLDRDGRSASALVAALTGT